MQGVVLKRATLRRVAAYTPQAASTPGRAPAPPTGGIINHPTNKMVVHMESSLYTISITFSYHLQRCTSPLVRYVNHHLAMLEKTTSHGGASAKNYSVMSGALLSSRPRRYLLFPCYKLTVAGGSSADDYLRQQSMI